MVETLLAKDDLKLANEILTAFEEEGIRQKLAPEKKKNENGKSFILLIFPLFSREEEEKLLLNTNILNLALQQTTKCRHFPPSSLCTN